MRSGRCVVRRRPGFPGIGTVEVKERSTRIHGRKVRYLSAGDGPDVVLLHGGALGYSGDVWRGNMEAIAERGFRTLALDLPGYGGSDPLEQNSDEATKGSVQGFVDSLAIDKFCLLAHSHAGRLASEMALDVPNRILALVVVGTGSMLPVPEGESVPKRRPLAAPARADEEPDRERVRAAIANDLYDPSIITVEELETRYRMSTGARFAAHQARAAEPRSSRREGSPPLADLGKAPFPVQFVFGEQDQNMTVQSRVELLRSICPAIEVCVLERAKHLVQWDARQQFNDVVGSFLTRAVTASYAVS